jgi:tetratricopeptide (TPR) repeat protein
MATISEALAIAIQHHQAGRLQVAEQIYRQILAVEPNHADAWHLLGAIAHQVGKNEVAVEYIERAIRLIGSEAAFHSNLGGAYRALRRIPEAIACYRRALELKPDYAEAHYNLGVALKDQGKLDEAVACYRRALELKPDYAEARCNLGNVLRDQGNLDDAVDCYRRALELKPDFAAAHGNLGVVLNDQGRRDDAIACYRRALQLKPDFADAHNNLGAALNGQGKLAEALTCYRQALELKPDFAEAHSNLADALNSLGKPDEAVACCRRALELKPDFADAIYNLGNALNGQAKPDEAAACYRRVLELKPDFAEAHYNLGNALKDQGDLDDAVVCYRRAVQLKPDFADAHNNLGAALSGQRMLDDAAACYHRALELQPDNAEAHWNQSLLSLLTGDFPRGWAEYEWRWKTKQCSPRDFSQASWDGQPLEGRTILLHAEQGLGDAIQFVRYAALVKQRGGAVIVECPKPLLSLLMSCAGIDRLVGRGDELPAFDVRAPLESLPGIFHTVLGDIPAAIPYLFADAGLAERWRQELDRLAGFKIGIAWQGSPKNPNDRNRSIPLGSFEPLARCSGVRLLSLQKDWGLEQLPEVAGRFPVTELGSRLENFMDTAAVLVNLDLMITCDSAVAHLAGALGVPVWVALPFAPDWRWLLDRSDSPWYPTMRLFRQDRRGDWQGVFQKIEVALGERLASLASVAPGDGRGEPKSPSPSGRGPG